MEGFVSKLKNATAIVTGSSSGIGAATALMLAQRGCNIVVHYVRNESGARAVADQVRSLGVEAEIAQGDVTNDEICRGLARAALDRWGRIDVLVNNGGVTKFVDQRDLGGLTAEDFQRIYGVNVIGAYQMVRACQPAMQRQGDGAIINMASLGGLNGHGSSTAYVASKGALISMTYALARALGPEVRVNAICPGFVDNEWGKSVVDEQTREAFKNKFENTAPLRRALTSEDVAAVVVWLAEGARGITGEIFRIDSGAHLVH
jgi:3-oxoacyl-[acyl-carrier protein] reductase